MCQSPSFNKVAGLKLAASLKKETLTQLFSCEFCETPKNTFLHRTPLVLTSYVLVSYLNSQGNVSQKHVQKAAAKFQSRDCNIYSRIAFKISPKII